MFIAWAMCRVKCKSSCLVLQLQSADYLERWRSALNEAGLLVSINEVTQDPEHWAQYS
jgi:hypothetical protein